MNPKPSHTVQSLIENNIYVAGYTVHKSQAEMCQIADRGPCKHQADVDGATVYGSWAYMCSSHHITHGRGLGTGRGQVMLQDPKPSQEQEQE